jgi:carboxylate-amine ligase
VDPATGEHMALRDHIMQTMDRIGPHAGALNASSGIHLLRSSVELSNNDARWLRERQAQERLLAEVIRQGAQKFRGL